MMELIWKKVDRGKRPLEKILQKCGSVDKNPPRGGKPQMIFVIAIGLYLGLKCTLHRAKSSLRT